MFDLPDLGMCDFVVRCKGCHQNVPAPVETMPASWITLVCPLCGEHRAYLPPDIFRGRLSYLMYRKPVLPERHLRRAR